MSSIGPCHSAFSIRRARCIISMFHVVFLCLLRVTGAFMIVGHAAVSRHPDVSYRDRGWSDRPWTQASPQRRGRRTGCRWTGRRPDDWSHQLQRSRQHRVFGPAVGRPEQERATRTRAPRVVIVISHHRPASADPNAAVPTICARFRAAPCVPVSSCLCGEACSGISVPSASPSVSVSPATDSAARCRTDPPYGRLCRRRRPPRRPSHSGPFVPFRRSTRRRSAVSSYRRSRRSRDRRAFRRG